MEDGSTITEGNGHFSSHDMKLLTHTFCRNRDRGQIYISRSLHFKILISNLENVFLSVYNLC
jgi:hypothetical protein